MKPIEATARFRVGQLCLQVVFTEEPLKRAQRFRRPLGAVIRSRCSKASGDCRRSLDWLLIERFRFLAPPAEALGPNRSKVSR
jgi:hypothetical protein